jgi:hypothetical protein
MMRAHFKNRLVEKKRAIEEVIEQYRANKFEFCRLKKKRMLKMLRWTFFEQHTPRAAGGSDPCPGND